MLRSFFIPVVFAVLAFNTANTVAKAGCWKSKDGKYDCVGVSKFSILDEAPSNVRLIGFRNSEMTNVPTNIFSRFRSTLKSIDMHLAGIQSIESGAFNSLTNLMSLTLWGNSLDAVYAHWFTNLTQLRTLDVSFNRISYIEETAFQLLPYLENLYMDSNRMVTLNWNVFSYLGNLRTVKLGKNPWNWWYRAQIALQLENQHVDYNSEWDDYDWINHVVWNCMQKHQAKYEDDSVLDCASSYLIEERSKIGFYVESNTHCATESKELYDCSMRSDPILNITITPKIAVRKILQGFMRSFNSLRNPDVTLTEACSNADTVTISTLDERQIKLDDVSFSETVDILKRKIARELGSRCNDSSCIKKGEEWPPERQRLWAYGCYLENGRTLSDYHLKSGDRIYLTLCIE